MDSHCQRDFKQLINSTLYLIKCHQFHKSQVGAEKQRLDRSMERASSMHVKLEHVGQIREYLLRMKENLKQLRLHNEKLKHCLDLIADLKETDIYKEALKVVMDANATIQNTEQVNDGDPNNVNN